MKEFFLFVTNNILESAYKLLMMFDYGRIMLKERRLDNNNQPNVC
ncbi:hypothetical protein BD809_104211 [Aquimarina intermedia]|uniref:Uncharacterized protein n=1 Tax=Aquimarina intermedia TaxID=350814 RepID=A0A5S5C4N9_9FLAO|nr:hypothetical protein BD809_104211 [Aquimarina intermedia]